MPRVHHVKKARKAQKAHGIAKGESYFWWQFRFGGKRVSKSYPKRSQLTQSEFLSTMYDAEDQANDIATQLRKGDITFEDAQSAIESIKDEVSSQGEECQSRRDNMPEQLQESDSGQLLGERVEKCEGLASELENIDFTAGTDLESELEDLQDDSEEELRGKKEEELDRERETIAGEIEGLSWDF